MSKLAVFFPGIGYTADKPLLYYSRRIAASLGFEIKIIDYTGFPDKVIGDRSRMEESFRIAIEYAMKIFAEIDLAAYEDVLFIGKSIGTIVAAKIASESPDKDKIRLILYTPLEDTFSFEFGKAIAFTGTDDPWVGREKSRISALCDKRNIPCSLVSKANHSLESDCVVSDIGEIMEIMRKMECFIKSDI